MQAVAGNSEVAPGGAMPNPGADPDEAHDLHSYRFGGFELEPLSGRLRHGGEPRRLRLQSARVLHLLVSSPRRIVRREDIRRWLWGDETYVDYEQGINTCVREIRIALSDDANDPRYVQTVPGVGYRFVAQVERIVTEAEGEGPEPPGAEARGAGERDGHGDPARVPQSVEGSARGRASMVAAGFFLLAVVVIALLAGVRGAETRSARGAGSIRALLIDLENHTGDPLLDESLATALRIGLGQYGGLSLVPAAEVRGALVRMKRDPDAPPDPALYRELAQRVNVDRLIVGHTLLLGEEYLVAVEILDPESGRTVRAVRRTAESKEQLLEALDRVVDDLAGGLLAAGETASTEPRPPLAQVTTPNLEALRAYSLAEREIDRGQYAEALYLLGRSVELDPEFAMAHARIGVISRNHLDLATAKEHFRLASRSAARLTPFEALYVDGWLATIEPEPDRAIELWTRMARLYPESPIGHYNLAMARKSFYDDLAGCADSMSWVIEGLPTSALPGFARLYRAQCRQGLGDAQAAIDDVRAFFDTPDLEGPALAEGVFRLASLGMLDEAEHYLGGELMHREQEGELGEEAVLGNQRTLVVLALERGRAAEALEPLFRAAALAERNGLVGWELAARLDAIALLDELPVSPAEREALVTGAWRRGRELLVEDDLPDRSLVLRGAAELGVLLAREGRVEWAQELRDRFASVRESMSSERLWQGYLDLLDAELALQAGRPRVARTLLEHSLTEVPGPPYHGLETLARSYLATGDVQKAEAAYLRLARTRGEAYAEALGSEISLDFGANLAAHWKARRLAKTPATGL